MAILNKPTRVEYMCSYCGRKETRGIMMGRPTPGECLRKGKTAFGKSKPHSWRINKKF